MFNEHIFVIITCVWSSLKDCLTLRSVSSLNNLQNRLGFHPTNLRLTPNVTLGSGLHWNEIMNFKAGDEGVSNSIKSWEKKFQIKGWNSRRSHRWEVPWVRMKKWEAVVKMIKNERSKWISKSLCHPPSGRKLPVVFSFLIRVLFLWQCFMLLSKVSRGSFERRGGAFINSCPEEPTAASLCRHIPLLRENCHWG